MLNRIRRTASHLRERYLYKGRHRRSETPAGPLPVLPEVAYGAVLFLRWHREHTGVLVGEETALVRPYVLASEARTRHRSAAVSSAPLADPWYASAGDF
ncbi:hypothetical protein GCM10010294_41820 [Streptomyces griseoloalbus]|uniref:hypothetical protein n=1 Tax=Streptomyces griseoloalbus TaxID=67303 RepID=UPI0018768B35|nr:hypothetical protein GCM10010294_41820 [Streptomyces griseoloalbus]